MHQNRREIFALVLGAVLLLLSIRLNSSLDFTPVYLVGQRREWEIGPREIAHLVGLAGFTVMVWYLISSFASKRLIALNLALTVCVGAGLALTWPEYDLLYDLLGLNTLEIARMSPIYVAAWMLLLLVAWKTPNLLFPVPALLSACGVLVATTAFWELYVQPFDNVYGKPPRGGIEMGQVVFDLVGVLIGALIVLRLHGWPGPLHKGKADNFNGCAQSLES